MRISDWSSDVCSSDLTAQYLGCLRRFFDSHCCQQPLDSHKAVTCFLRNFFGGGENLGQWLRKIKLTISACHFWQRIECGLQTETHIFYPSTGPFYQGRSEERRVGQECVRTGKN